MCCLAPSGFAEIAPDDVNVFAQTMCTHCCAVAVPAFNDAGTAAAVDVCNALVAESDEVIDDEPGADLVVGVCCVEDLTC
jgi:hypothetical protein